MTETDDTTRLSGETFSRVVRAGALAVVREQESLNRINVFPVRDADTGANLAATLRAAASRLGSAAPASVGDAARVAADGALDGARGNSGAIFAQFLHGLASSMERLRNVDGRSSPTPPWRARSRRTRPCRTRARGRSSACCAPGRTSSAGAPTRTTCPSCSTAGSWRRGRRSPPRRASSRSSPAATWWTRAGRASSTSSRGSSTPCGQRAGVGGLSRPPRTDCRRSRTGTTRSTTGTASAPRRWSRRATVSRAGSRAGHGPRHRAGRVAGRGRRRHPAPRAHPHQRAAALHGAVAELGAHRAHARSTTWCCSNSPAGGAIAIVTDSTTDLPEDVAFGLGVWPCR